MFFKGAKQGVTSAALIALALLFSTTLAFSDEDPKERDAKARQKLAEKLSNLSKSYAMKEARFQNGSEEDVDRNSGNTSKSNSTYHSFTWDYCLKTYGGGNCEKWLDPYVSKHGIEADNEGQSNLENKIGQLWSGMKKDGDSGQGGSYGIWNVQSRGGGSVLDAEGRLDRTVLTKFELKKQVVQESEQIGYDTASKAIATTYDEDAPKNTMPNMESLRLMAGRFTRMFRNRMVTNVGEIRAGERGIEFTLAEDISTCEDYLKALQQIPDEIDQERIKYQARLDPETFQSDVKRRYQLCVQARNKSVYKGDERVQIDKTRSQLNVAAIDYGGIDVRKLPRPENIPITEQDTTTEVGRWNDGGTEMEIIRENNAATMRQYNEQVRSAAQAMREVAARSENIPDASEEIMKHQLEIGKTSLVELNGLTKEMKSELRDTKAPSVQPQQNATNPNPDRNFEDAPSQLTVTAAR